MAEKLIKEKNFELEGKLSSLQSLLRRRDKIGYAAARNTRILSDALTEFFNFRSDIMRKYGKEETDEDGKPTGQLFIKADNPHYKEAVDEITKLGNIEQEVSIMTIDSEDVIGTLSGEEILSIDWMFSE